MQNEPGQLLTLTKIITKKQKEKKPNMHHFTRMTESYLKKAVPAEAERFRAMSEPYFAKSSVYPNSTNV